MAVKCLQIFRVGLQGASSLVLLILFVILGACNILLLKIQNEFVVKGCDNGPPRKFSHGAFQSLLLFLGMSLFLIIHGFESACSRKKKAPEGKPYVIIGVVRPEDDLTSSENGIVAEDDEGLIPIDGDGSIQEERKKKKKADAEIEEKPEVNPLVVLFASFCGCVSTNLLTYALILTYASVFGMLFNLKIVATALVAFVFLRRRMLPHHLLAVFFLCVGGALVTASSIFTPSSSQSSDSPEPTLGALMVLASIFAMASLYVFEEAVLSKFKITAAQCVALEGSWGIPLVAFTMVMFQYLPGTDAGSLQNSQQALCQIVQSPYLLVCVIMQVVVVGAFNWVALSLTKRVGATARQSADTLRIIVVWLVQFLRGRDTFSWMQLAGFSLIVLGAFIFNDIIRIPVYGSWAESKFDPKKPYFRWRDCLRGMCCPSERE